MKERVSKRSHKLFGIILRKTKFQESSLIFELLSPIYGKISLISKGARKEKSKFLGIFDLFNIVEIEAISSPNSNLFLVKSANMIESKLPKKIYENFVAASIASEILLNIEFEDNENEQFYQLFISLMDYLPKVSQNQVLIIWRFFLKIYSLLGIEFNITECSICKSKLEKSFYYSTNRNNFVCRNCANVDKKYALIRISDNLQLILSKFRSIGNLLNEIEVTKTSKETFNAILLDYFKAHFHTDINIKSLKYL